MAAKKIYNETSQSIIDGAITVMAEKGLSNLTTKRVSAEADVSTASIHYFFDTKERLIYESFSHVVDTMWQELEAVQTGQDEPLDVVKKLLDVFYIDARTNIKTLKIWPQLWLHASTNAQTGQLFRDYNDKVVALFSDYLKRAGLKPKMARLYAFRLNTLHRGLWIELNVGGSMKPAEAQDLTNAVMVTIENEIMGENS